MSACVICTSYLLSASSVIVVKDGWKHPVQSCPVMMYTTVTWHGERLCKKIARHVIWTGRMLWIVVDGRSWSRLDWWSGWSVGECFFWYRLTRVVPEGRKTVVVVVTWLLQVTTIIHCDWCSTWMKSDCISWSVLKLSIASSLSSLLSTSVAGWLSSQWGIWHQISA